MSTTIEEVHISPDKAAKYLSIYVGDSDWPKHISILWGKLVKKYGAEDAKIRMRKILACTILLPATDRTKVPDNPENLLYWVQSYHQFNDRDWEHDLGSVFIRDGEISSWRNQALSLGVIYPLQYSPITRQAYNWLYNMGIEECSNIDQPPDKLEVHARNMVLAYGGVVISNIFEKYGSNIKRKVLTWRNLYFFERLIFDTYSIGQVMKIKKQELEQTNASLVKKIRAD